MTKNILLKFHLIHLSKLKRNDYKTYILSTSRRARRSFDRRLGFSTGCRTELSEDATGLTHGPAIRVLTLLLVTGLDIFVVLEMEVALETFRSIFCCGWVTIFALIRWVFCSLSKLRLLKKLYSKYTICIGLSKNISIAYKLKLDENLFHV